MSRRVEETQKELERKLKKEKFEELPEGVKAIISATSEASKRSRSRDIESSKILSDKEMEIANELQAKAQSKGMKLVPEKKVKNRGRFVQISQDNLKVLMENQYLKNEEITFLFRIMPYIGIRSNCIIDDIHKKDPVPLTQSDIAKVIKASRTNTTRLINQLIDKGIIAKAETFKDHTNARSYALFLNPNIIYSGDRDNVNDTLKIMFEKANKRSELKNLPQNFC
jgi:DNA-binding MarR family transcriptional regulator